MIALSYHSRSNICRKSYSQFKNVKEFNSHRDAVSGEEGGMSVEETNRLLEAGLTEEAIKLIL
ncbi:hypothetical protein [Neobacillus niacini]|uniref:hypothetical protein n=1 Tax=Neobacillus niacini TaxID=86668 RepID=UPI001C8EBE10|nr:hypothetical protein [Neobacillus niacini]MBY0149228.1 hypothetical protein [Neobacillus niacini]